MSKGKICGVACIALVLAVLALYARTGWFAYIRLDDWGYTAGCPFVPGGLTWENVAQAFSRITYGGIWMPLTYVSYMADVTLFGGGWGVHHAVNAALHAINAIIVFLFVLSFLRSIASSFHRSSLPSGAEPPERLPVAAAFLAALIWAVHPQRVEAVAWIASRKEELWTLFTLLGLMAWKGRRFRLGTLCCALACLSKPTAVCFPLLAFVVEAMLLRFSAEREAMRKITAVTHFAQVKTIWAKVFFRYFVLCLIALITGLAAIGAQTHPEGMAEVQVLHVPFIQRLFNAAASLGFGLVQFVFPFEVHFDYLELPIAAKTGACALLGALVAIPLAVCIVRKRRISPSAAFCVLMFALSWLPVSGLAGSFGESPMADRFLYMPMVAVALASACFLARRNSRAWHFAAFAFAMMCGMAAWPVIASYRNDFTAFSRTLAFEPDHWRALQRIGSEYCARLGKMDEGIEMMRRSYAISPRDSTAEVLAYSLACRGDSADVPEILKLCAKFIRYPQLDKRGMFAESLGIAAIMRKRWGDAILYLRASIAAPQRFYADTEARFRLADALSADGKHDDARSILRPLTLSDDSATRRRAFSMLDAVNRP